MCFRFFFCGVVLWRGTALYPAVACTRSLVFTHRFLAHCSLRVSFDDAEREVDELVVAYIAHYRRTWMRRTRSSSFGRPACSPSASRRFLARLSPSQVLVLKACVGTGAAPKRGSHAVVMDCTISTFVSAGPFDLRARQFPSSRFLAVPRQRGTRVCQASVTLWGIGLMTAWRLLDNTSALERREWLRQELALAFRRSVNG